MIDCEQLGQFKAAVLPTRKSGALFPSEPYSGREGKPCVKAGLNLNGGS